MGANQIMNYTPLLLTAIKAAIIAGQEILKIYNTDFKVEHKADKSPLTLADKRAHDIISDYLQNFNIPILSEEGREIPYDERKEWDLFWIVDPLDGTKEFVKRNGEFTVNIALTKGNQPVAGVIFLPVKKILYFTGPEISAWKTSDLQVISWIEKINLKENTDALLKQIISASVSLPVFDPDHCYTVMGSRSHATKELDAFVDKLRRTHKDLQYISAGSSLKFCLVAEGKADIYPRLGPTMEWDTAAGHIIAKNAGARVYCQKTNLPLEYNKENLLNPWFIVEHSDKF